MFVYALTFLFMMKLASQPSYYCEYKVTVALIEGSCTKASKSSVHIFEVVSIGKETHLFFGRHTNAVINAVLADITLDTKII